MALEILMGSFALSASIREGKLQQIPNSIQMGRKEGMCSLNDSLLELLARNLIEPTEAYQTSASKDELLKRMAAAEDDWVKFMKNAESAGAVADDGRQQRFVRADAGAPLTR